MRWMEFIKVQTTKPNVDEMLHGIVRESKDCHGLLEARVFNHVSVDDCSLCLHWNTDLPKLQGSTIGLYLSSILKQYGLVDHTVWMEKDQKEERASWK